MNGRQRKFKSTPTSAKSSDKTLYEKFPLFQCLGESWWEEGLNKTGGENLNNQEEKQPTTGSKQIDNNPLNPAETKNKV